MHTHPQGPSATNLLCPKNAPLGEFSNNTAHSLGWFGLWTFEDYFPMDGEILITVLSHFMLHFLYWNVVWIISQVKAAVFDTQGLCAFLK